MGKTKKVIIALFSAIVLVLGVAGCSSGANDLQSKIDNLQSQLEEINNRLTEMEEDNKKLNDEIDALEDEIILKNQHEATIDEDFEDNKVWVILKSSFKHISEIGFEDFEIVEQVSEITSIRYGLKTITREDGVKLSLEDEKYKMFLLELSTHDKGKVLAVIAQLKKSDMVLVSLPDYIYDTTDD